MCIRDRTAAIDIHGPAKIAAWIDGKPVEVESISSEKESVKTNKLKINQVKLLLEPGTHTLLIRFDANAIPDAVRVQSNDVTFATELDADN